VEGANCSNKHLALVAARLSSSRSRRGRGRCVPGHSTGTCVAPTRTAHHRTRAMASTSSRSPLEHPRLHEDRPGSVRSGPPRPTAENFPSPSRPSRGSKDSSSEPPILLGQFRGTKPTAELDRPRTSEVRVFATARRTTHQEPNSDAPQDGARGAREARVKTSARTSEFLYCKLEGQSLEDLLRLDLGSSRSPAMPPGPILFRSQTF